MTEPLQPKKEMAMQGVELFQNGQDLLAILVRASATSEQKYNFLTPPGEPFQLGVNFYGRGEVIKNHAHLPREIRVDRVQELILISSGRARLFLYDDDRKEVARTELGTGDAVLLLRGGHGFELLEETKIVEIKQGPYDGHSADKVVF
jgi:hypothetical protein